MAEYAFPRALTTSEALQIFEAAAVATDSKIVVMDTFGKVVDASRANKLETIIMQGMFTHNSSGLVANFVVEKSRSKIPEYSAVSFVDFEGDNSKSLAYKKFLLSSLEFNYGKIIEENR